MMGGSDTVSMYVATSIQIPAGGTKHGFVIFAGTEDILLIRSPAL